ncbi:hypothetical protein [Ideonella paludis]|uniref:hypothetical protein n=1 Tax=Ideonella paludis TaxID=1233411 RepID=UPI003624B7BD
MRMRSDKGLAYVEAVLATVMVAVLLAPALNALSSGLMGQQVADTQAEQALALHSKLEEVLAKPYSVLLAETYTLGATPRPRSAWTCQTLSARPDAS